MAHIELLFMVPVPVVRNKYETWTRGRMKEENMRKSLSTVERKVIWNDPSM